MSGRRFALRGIVPPHVLKALLESEDPKIRDAGRRSLVGSTRMRERRALLGLMPLGAPAGELRRTIYDARKGTNLPGTFVRGEGDARSRDGAVNEAYDGLGDTYAFYKEVLGRNSIDDRGLRLDASVHYGVDFDNAYWDGRQMVFGDGDGRIFVRFTTALEVIGHELTHGVTQHTSNFEYHLQPGALNESMSDVFGSLVKQYALKQTAAQADWLIGKGILAPGVRGVALRSMKDPGTAYDDPKLGGKDPQPGHMDRYVDLPDDEDDDWGGVHINSGIPNRAFYLAATKLGGKAWEKAGPIWYKSLQRLWAKAQFADCARMTVQVAGELYGTNSAEANAVHAAWSEVGVEADVPKPTRRATVGAGNGAAPRKRGAEATKKKAPSAQRSARKPSGLPPGGGRGVMP